MNRSAASRSTRTSRWTRRWSHDLERSVAGTASRPIRFSTPTFKDYASTELKGCSKISFPSFSITAGACGLNCDHCRAEILKPMLAATSPAMLDQKVRHLVATQNLQGFLLSGGSNRRNEISLRARYLEQQGGHFGQDFSCPYGTEVYATGNGKVTVAGWNSDGFGYHVVIDHGYGFQSIYGHLSKIEVPIGLNIKRGDLIGLSGNSGTSSGPHLHYQVDLYGSHQNPMHFFNDNLSQEDYLKMITVLTSKSKLR